MAYIAAMTGAGHAVIETPGFIRDAKAAGLSEAERNELRSILTGLAADYRKGVRRRVKGR